MVGSSGVVFFLSASFYHVDVVVSENKSMEMR